MGLYALSYALWAYMHALWDIRMCYMPGAMGPYAMGYGPTRHGLWASSRWAAAGDLDGSALEQYMEENDFVQTLGMSRADFYALPKWKSAACWLL